MHICPLDRQRQGHRRVDHQRKDSSGELPEGIPSQASMLAPIARSLPQAVRTADKFVRTSLFTRIFRSASDFYALSMLAARK
jgi:hypothetical protein